MNAPVHPEQLSRLDPVPPGHVPRPTEAALRVRWESRFGTVLIEVVDGVVHVNGEPVEPARPDDHRIA